MSDQKLIAEENEFADRDAQGLMVKEDVNSEEVETAKYFKMLILIIPIVGQVLAWSLYFVLTTACGRKEILDQKFAFIYEYELGYVFLAVFITKFARDLLIVNANGARAPARLDRPDQHIYKIMARDGPLKDAPYVMMAATGAAGRFNRAQRGVFNTDEGMPLFLTNTLLASSVFGPAAIFLSLVAAYGRVTFGKCYKESSKSRGKGFLPAMIGEGWMSALVLLCAIKGLLFTKIPF